MSFEFLVKSKSSITCYGNTGGGGGGGGVIRKNIVIFFIENHIQFWVLINVFFGSVVFSRDLFY